ncbi:Ankyrin repeat domain 13C [Pelomyxa schiedti]|nr:Ankyrin repeat domain 13C [Pelomyxa schiedti]
MADDVEAGTRDYDAHRRNHHRHAHRHHRRDSDDEPSALLTTHLLPANGSPSLDSEEAEDGGKSTTTTAAAATPPSPRKHHRRQAHDAADNSATATPTSTSTSTSTTTTTSTSEIAPSPSTSPAPCKTASAAPRSRAASGGGGGGGGGSGPGEKAEPPKSVAAPEWRTKWDVDYICRCCKCFGRRAGTGPCTSSELYCWSLHRAVCRRDYDAASRLLSFVPPEHAVSVNNTAASGSSANDGDEGNQIGALGESPVSSTLSSSSTSTTTTSTSTSSSTAAADGSRESTQSAEQCGISAQVASPSPPSVKNNAVLPCIPRQLTHSSHAILPSSSSPNLQSSLSTATDATNTDRHSDPGEITDSEDSDSHESDHSSSSDEERDVHPPSAGHPGGSKVPENVISKATVTTSPTKPTTVSPATTSTHCGIIVPENEAWRWSAHHHGINSKDHHGIPALHYAIHLRDLKMTKLLLAHGASPSTKNFGGWSAVHEAIAAKDRQILQLVMQATHARFHSAFANKANALFGALETIPDFYVEMTWEFRSWVPLLSKFCPRDSYRIYKRGSSFRVDTTLIGFGKVQWVRGNVSFILLGKGQANAGDFVVVDWDNHTVSTLMSASNDVPYADLEDEADGLLTQNIATTETPATFSLQPVQSWSKKLPKYEQIGPWRAQLFQLSDFGLRTHTRKWAKKTVKDKTSTPKAITSLTMTEEEMEIQEQKIKSTLAVTTKIRDVEVKETIYDNEYFSAAPCDHCKGLMYPSESVSHKFRAYKGTVWLTSEFPRQVREILPIFEVLSPTNKHFERLCSFIKNNLPDPNMFPVKLEVPVFPTISGIVTFEVYKNNPDLDWSSLFQIPSTFTPKHKKL